MHLIAEAEGKCIPVPCTPPLPSQAANCRGEALVSGLATRQTHWIDPCHLICLGLGVGKSMAEICEARTPRLPTWTSSWGAPAPGPLCPPLEASYGHSASSRAHSRSGRHPNSLSLRQAWSRGCPTSSSWPFSQMRSSVKSLLMAAVVMVFNWEGRTGAGAEGQRPQSVPFCPGGLSYL